MAGAIKLRGAWVRLAARSPGMAAILGASAFGAVCWIVLALIGSPADAALSPWRAGALVAAVHLLYRDAEAAAELDWHRRGGPGGAVRFATVRVLTTGLLLTVLLLAGPSSGEGLPAWALPAGLGLVAAWFLLAGRRPDPDRATSLTLRFAPDTGGGVRRALALALPVLGLAILAVAPLTPWAGVALLVVPGLVPAIEPRTGWLLPRLVGAGLALLAVPF